MSDTQPTIEVTHADSVQQPKPRPAPARAPAAPADPAPSTPPEIVTTIALKPGVKITIEYPAVGAS